MSVADDLKLDELLAAARAKVDAMTPAEREAMFEEQRKSYVRAEMAFGDEGTRTVPSAEARSAIQAQQGEEG